VEEEYNVRNRVWKKYQEEELKTTNPSLFQKDLFNEASEI
jgi:hypothetical protein